MQFEASTRCVIYWQAIREKAPCIIYSQRRVLIDLSRGTSTVYAIRVRLWSDASRRDTWRHYLKDIFLHTSAFVYVVSTMSGGGARWRRGLADDVRGKHACNRGIELDAPGDGSEVTVAEREARHETRAKGVEDDSVRITSSVRIVKRIRRVRRNTV